MTFDQGEKEPGTAGGPPRLKPVLGLFSACAIVVGGVIGSGVFIKPKEISQGFVAVESTALATERSKVAVILGLWVACGVINLFGALTLAELSAMYPHAGGTYVFLREAYGKAWAFLWTWAEFWVIRSGSIAALSVAMTISLQQAASQAGWNPPPNQVLPLQVGISLAVIAILSALNIAGAKWGGGLQNVTSVIKAGSVALLALLPFLAAVMGPGPDSAAAAAEIDDLPATSLLAALGSALYGIMWAYDGWGNVTVVAEEIKNPRRNLPLALTLGMIVLTVLYVGANVAYHRTLPLASLAAAPVPAEAVCQRLIGPAGASMVVVMLCISAFGALNNNVLIGPRVQFAVARDHTSLSLLNRIDPRFGTPLAAIVGLSAWSCLLVLGSAVMVGKEGFRHDSATLFDTLTGYCIFGGSIFYFTAVLAVFVLRIRKPDVHRPYKTFGYPVVPAIFAVFYVLLLVLLFLAAPWASLIGLSLIGLGGLFYAFIGRRSSKSTTG
jgi:amino acid transporter